MTATFTLPHLQPVAYVCDLPSTAVNWLPEKPMQVAQQQFLQEKAVVLPPVEDRRRSGRRPLSSIAALNSVELPLANVVSCFSLGDRVDLKAIAMAARNVEYNPKRISACIMAARHGQDLRHRQSGRHRLQKRSDGQVGRQNIRPHCAENRQNDLFLRLSHLQYGRSLRHEILHLFGGNGQRFEERDLIRTRKIPRFVLHDAQTQSRRCRLRHRQDFHHRRQNATRHPTSFPQHLPHLEQVPGRQIDPFFSIRLLTSLFGCCLRSDYLFAVHLSSISFCMYVVQQSNTSVIFKHVLTTIVFICTTHVWYNWHSNRTGFSKPTSSTVILWLAETHLCSETARRKLHFMFWSRRPCLMFTLKFESPFLLILVFYLAVISLAVIILI